MAEPSILTAAGGAASETVGQQAMPFRRTILWITLGFFLILLASGIILSFQEHSYQPLLEKTLYKVIASDKLLGDTATELATGAHPPFTGIFQKTFPVWLWWVITTVFDIISSAYFIFFLGWVIFLIFRSINNTSPLRNIILTITTYIILMFLISTSLWVAENNSRTLPQGKNEAIRAWALSTFPGQGLFKMAVYFINQQTLIKISDWTSTSPAAAIITNIPQQNSSLNSLTNGTR